MNKKIYKSVKLIFPILLLVPLMLLVWPHLFAAALVDVQGNSLAAGSSTSSLVVTYSVVTTLTTGDTVELMYDSSLVASGALATSDVVISRVGAGTLGTWTVDTEDVGYVHATAGATTNLTSSDDLVITIGGGANFYTLTSTTGNYSVSVVSDTDNGAGLFYVGDDNDVHVTATVVSVIDLEIFGDNSTATKLVGAPNPCNLGLLSISLVKSCVYYVGTSNNGTNTLTVYVDDTGTNPGLAKGVGATNIIADVADGTVTAGQEEYGFSISTAGSYTASGTFGTSYQGVPNGASATEFMTIAGIHDTVSVSGAGNRAGVTHQAAISAVVEVGTYVQDLTYTAMTTN